MNYTTSMDYKSLQMWPIDLEFFRRGGTSFVWRWEDDYFRAGPLPPQQSVLARGLGWLQETTCIPDEFPSTRFDTWLVVLHLLRKAVSKIGCIK